MKRINKQPNTENTGKKRTRGYNKVKWTEKEFDIFEKLCQKFCEQKEIADIMHTSIRAINNICKENYFDEYDDYRPMTFGQVQDMLRSKGRLRVREKQWEAIEKGNTTMLLWYGKNYLGQKDNPTIDNSMEEIKNNINSLSEILTAPKENRSIDNINSLSENKD